MIRVFQEKDNQLAILSTTLHYLIDFCELFQPLGYNVKTYWELKYIPLVFSRTEQGLLLRKAVLPELTQYNKGNSIVSRKVPSSYKIYALS